MIRFEHTTHDGAVMVTIETKEESLYDILTTFKGFLSACTFTIDPLADLEFVNTTAEDNIIKELDKQIVELDIENDKLRKKIRKLKKKLANKNVKVDCEIGREEFVTAAAKLLIQNLESSKEAEISKEIEECGCRRDSSDIPCIFHD